MTGEDRSIAWGELGQVSSMPGCDSLDVTTKGKKRAEAVEIVTGGEQWSRRMVHVLIPVFGLRRNRWFCTLPTVR